MSTNNLFALSVGLGLGGVTAYFAHHNLRGCLITSHCLIKEYADTSRKVQGQLIGLAERAVDEDDEEGVRHVYSTLSRHDYTLSKVLNSAEREYRILQRAYKLWSTSTFYGLMRRPDKRYYFEDFMESPEKGESEADNTIQEMRLIRRRVGQIKKGLEELYPALKNGSEAAAPTAQGIRRERVLSSPR